MSTSAAREAARKRRVSRQQASRWQRDRRTRRIVFGLIVLVVLAILAVPAYGYYREFVAPSSELVSKVNSRTFSMGYYVKRLRLLTLTMGDQLDFSQVPFQLVDNIENEELARLGAPRLGITASPEEVTAAIREMVQPSTSADAEVDPKKLDAEFGRLYKQYLNTAKLSEKEHRDIVKAQILMGKVREQVGERVPRVAPQVRVQAIVADNAEVLDMAKKRLEKGEDFTAISAELSTDEDVKAAQGGVGWMPRGVKGLGFDEMVFNLELNQVSDPISWGSFSGQMAIVQVVEKSDARQISGDHLETLKTRALEEWLLAERKNNKIERSFDSFKYEWAISQVLSQREGK